MTDQEFFKRLRTDASRLRYEGDGFMTARVAARVRERITAAPTVSLLLANWLRPIAASLSAVALVACVSVAVLERASNENVSMESMTSTSGIEIAMDGDIYSVE